MFYLMNKDSIVATFTIKTTLFDTAILDSVLGTLPVDCTEDSFSGWIEHRHAVKHRKHLDKYLAEHNANTLSGFLRLTHAVSLNDTFWVKEDSDQVSWSDVSPYTNEFDETIQRIAFSEMNISGTLFSSTSPEFTTEGSFAKCWKRNDNTVYMYKRGTEHFCNAGNEPYSEVLASQLFVAMKAGIPYSLDVLHDKVASKCKLFTNESIGYIPQARLCNKLLAFDELLSQYDSYSNGELFRRILVCDALTFNTDRHTGNFGCLFNTDTMEVLGVAPGFDYNLSLFPMEVNDAFVDVNSFVNKYTPSQGSTFVDLARYVMTDSIRSDIKNLRGFEYKYEGDDKFPKERAEWLTTMTNEQIDNILGTNSVYMYTSPNKEVTSNLYKYRIKNNLSEEDFQKDVPRLMKLFGISHMSELEELIVELI